MAILTLRDLNRATLARQLLLERVSMPIPAAIEQLVGLQAQIPMPPYIGLWTRLYDFQRKDLARLIDEKIIVRATFLRGTLHLFTAQDYLHFRTTLQPVLSAGAEAITKSRGVELDIDHLLTIARQYLTEKPRTFAEITAMFTDLMPDIDAGSIRYTVRMNLPMIQVPVSSGWGYPATPQFTLADAWLGQSIPQDDNLRALIFRYLAAFGPASVTDLQTWSGLGKLKDSVEKLRPELRTYRDETKRELFDLPDIELPNAEMPAPVRFLPEFDNVLLSHSNRTRVIADIHRPKVYLPGLRVAATFLVDGFVAGVWKVEKKKQVATLMMDPFAALTPETRAALAEEAEHLVRFIEPDAKSFEVQFSEG